MKFKTKLIVLDIIVVMAIILSFFVPAIAQDPTYHNFVDHRHEFGIDNFWNVVSNAPFAIVGLLGLLTLKKSGMKQLNQPSRPKMIMLNVFFIGVLLTAIGSAYYHYMPNNETLIWDRLPMTISFMAFFCLIMAYHLGEKGAYRLLWPLISIGLGSVLWWHCTEEMGHGDLRAYALVQFLPIILIPIIMIDSTAEAFKAEVVWKVMGFYVGAKLLEHYDEAIFNWIGMSGHALKHIVAAMGTWIVLVECRRVLTSNNAQEKPESYETARLSSQDIIRDNSTDI